MASTWPLFTVAEMFCRIFFFTGFLSFTALTVKEMFWKRYTLSFFSEEGALPPSGEVGTTFVIVYESKRGLRAEKEESEEVAPECTPSSTAPPVKSRALFFEIY